MANYSVKQLNFTKDGNTYTIAGETYENKAAASGGTDVSLVTTGDKYNWNNNKMDKATGAAPGRVLQIDSNGTPVWDDNPSATAIASATTAWLDANVSGGQTIAVDASLSVTGAAADAKVTGEIKSAFGDLPAQDEYTQVTLSRHAGSIDAAVVGSTIVFDSNSNLSYFEIPISIMVKRVYIYYRIYGNNREFPYSAFTSENNIVLAVYKDSGTDGDHKSMTLDVPSGARKLYFWSYGNANNYGQHSECRILNRMDVTNYINKFHPELPEYYYENSWIQNKITNIKSNTNIANGFVFGFVTDLHFGSNDLNSKLLIKEVLDQTSVDYFIAGGDYIANNGTETEIADAGETLLDYVRFCDNRILPIHGNHDFSVTTTNGQRSVDIGHAYNYIIRPIECCVNAVSGKMYWYKDINNVARIICLDGWENYPPTSNPNNTVGAWVSQEQYDWFIDLLNNSNGKNIVIITHSALNTNLENYVGTHAPVHAILKAFKNRSTYTFSRTGTLLDGETYSINIDANFTNCTGKLVCVISGHSHIDESSTEDGILNIVTTCDAHYSSDGEGAAQGTITEQAFDVYCIDCDNHAIKTIRVGRGVDRTFTYSV